MIKEIKNSDNKNNNIKQSYITFDNIICVNFLWSIPTIITILLVILMGILDAKNQPEILNVFVSKYQQEIIYTSESTVGYFRKNNILSGNILYYRTCPIYEYKNKLYDCINVINCCKSTHSLNQSYSCAIHEFPLYSYRSAYVSPDGYCSFTYSQSQYFVGLWLCFSFCILTAFIVPIIKYHYEINNSPNKNNIIKNKKVKNKKSSTKTKSNYIELKEEDDDDCIL